MRLRSQRKNKKPIFLVSLIAVLVIGGGLAYVTIARLFDKKVSTDVATRPTNDVDYGPPSQIELKAANDQKDDIIKAVTSNDQNVSSDIVASLARAEQSAPGEPLNIRVQIEGVSTGSCVVTLTKAGQTTVSKTFSVVFEATSSRCLDADIPASDFSDSGEWHLRVIVESGSEQSEPIEQTITVVK